MRIPPGWCNFVFGRLPLIILEQQPSSTCCSSFPQVCDLGQVGKPTLRARHATVNGGTLRGMSAHDDVARRGNLAAVGFALVFPTLITVMYFIVLAGHAWQQEAFSVGKIIQFAFPAVWVI